MSCQLSGIIKSASIGRSPVSSCDNKFVFQFVYTFSISICELFNVEELHCGYTRAVEICFCDFCNIVLVSFSPAGVYMCRRCRLNPRDGMSQGGFGYWDFCVFMFFF